MEKLPHVPFEFGWYSWDLGEYRPFPVEYTTYWLFPYETLPHLDDPAPTFTWLLQGGKIDDGESDLSAHDVELRQKLAYFASEAAPLGLKLPDAFVRFMRSPQLRSRIRSCTGCWFMLSDRLVPCPGFEGGYLIGFLRDQQDCIIWCLCLMPGDEHCIVALPMDTVEALPEYSALALCGDLDIGDVEPVADVAAPSEGGEASTDMASAISDIYVCAPSFESFIFRFWLENEIAWKLTGPDKTPLTDLERRYLDHYRRYPQIDA